MPSDECPCPNTWVCALIFYFRMETVGGDSGDCQASCHRVRCEVWGVRCEVWGGDSRERYQAELDWLRMTGGAAAARKCPTLSVPLRFPRGQLFSRSFPSFPSALRQSRHSAYFLTPFHHWLPGDWSGHIIKLLPLPLLLLLLSSPATRSPLICHWNQLIDHLNIWGRKAGVVVSAGLYFSQQGIIFELNLTEQIPNS